jgi:hypothetical protein
MDTTWPETLSIGLPHGSPPNDGYPEHPELFELFGQSVIPLWHDCLQVSGGLNMFQHQTNMYDAGKAMQPNNTPDRSCNAPSSYGDLCWQSRVCGRGCATPSIAIDPAVAPCKSHQVAPIGFMLPCPQCDRTFETNSALK